MKFSFKTNNRFISTPKNMGVSKYIKINGDKLSLK